MPEPSPAAEPASGSTSAAPAAAESTWNARDLGTVGFAGLGLYIVAGGLVAAGHTLLSANDVPDPGSFCCYLAVYVAVGTALFLCSRWLSRIAMPRSQSAGPTRVTPLLAAAVALVGVLVVVEQFDSVLRLALPFLTYGEDQEISWQWPVADAVIVAFGVVLFLRAGAIARLWERWNTK